jgi:predicted DCC family thiol-disulfide oxidoreductase YuxK
MTNVEIPLNGVNKLMALIPAGRTGLLIFDGECILCNALIVRLLKSDLNKSLVFATFSSNIITENFPDINLAGLQSQSIVFVTKRGVFFNSDAVLEIARTTGSYPIFSRFIGIIPVFVRNYIYRIIARYRYRWFGKTDRCFIPSPEDAGRFLY